MPDWSKWLAAMSIIGMLITGAIQQGRILERQDDLARDIQRLEQALLLNHPDTGKALGFGKED